MKRREDRLRWDSEQRKPRSLWADSVTGFISIAVTVLATLLSAQVSDFIYPSRAWPTPTTIILNLGYFVGGIVLLGLVIVGVARFMKTRDRTTILLKERLTEIYLSALKRSALNPELGSSNSHD